MLKKDIFVFPDMVSIDGRLSLDSQGDKYLFRYDNKNGFEKEIYIDLNNIADGNVAMVLYAPVTGSLFIHYGYSQICESMNTTHSEFLKICCVNGLMQIDRYQDRFFIKVFLPKGQFSLDSSTDDYSDNSFMTADCCHPLDWQYLPTYDLFGAKIENDKLYLNLGICRPTIEEASGNMHINYAGQCLDCIEGKHTYIFNFVKGEDAYIGYPYSRRKGRMINIEQAILLCTR